MTVEPKVFDLLTFLVQNRDRVVSKGNLLQSVWGGQIVSDSELVTRSNALRRRSAAMAPHNSWSAPSHARGIQIPIVRQSPALAEQLRRHAPQEIGPDALGDLISAACAIGAAGLLRAVQTPHPRWEESDSRHQVCSPFLCRVVRAHAGVAGAAFA